MENSKKVEKYECKICGKQHDIALGCFALKEKAEKQYDLRKNKNFLYGNIFLECLEKNKNFFDLFYEAYYLSEQNTLSHKYFNLEFALDYFAMELDCNPKVFFQAPEKTIEKLLNLGDISYNPARYNNCIHKDENGQIDYISLSFDLYSGISESKYTWNNRNCLYVTKEKDDKNKPIYRMYLETLSFSLTVLNQENRENEIPQIYHFNQLGNESSNIILAEEYSGKLAERIEDAIDTFWEEMADKALQGDTRWDVWLGKIEEDTDKNKLAWMSRKYEWIDKNDYCECYSTVYKGHSIRLTLKQEYNPLVESEKYPVHQFSVRISYDYAFTFIIGDDDVRKNRLFPLAEKIKKSTVQMENLLQQPALEEKRIEFTDVLVVSSSMYCKTNDHKIIPYRGIVNILTEEDKEEEYQIYVGYCPECRTYTAFLSDYRKLLEKGKPLCIVYAYNKAPQGKIQSDFKYKSQSVLALKGYNVQAGSNLTEEERQEILKKCLDTKIVEIHDLLDFLNWLVRTREPLAKYQNAISKWKKDIEFVEEYKKDERDTVVVNSLTIQSR